MVCEECQEQSYQSKTKNTFNSNSKTLGKLVNLCGRKQNKESAGGC